jgi:hypothetical protein
VIVLEYIIARNISGGNMKKTIIILSVLMFSTTVFAKRYPHYNEHQCNSFASTATGEANQVGWCPKHGGCIDNGRGCQHGPIGNLNTGLDSAKKKAATKKRN